MGTSDASIPPCLNKQASSNNKHTHLWHLFVTIIVTAIIITTTTTTITGIIITIFTSGLVVICWKVSARKSRSPQRSIAASVTNSWSPSSRRVLSRVSLLHHSYHHHHYHRYHHYHHCHLHHCSQGNKLLIISVSAGFS